MSVPCRYSLVTSALPMFNHDRGVIPMYAVTRKPLPGTGLIHFCFVAACVTATGERRVTVTEAERDH